jgi:hypothetical protein
MHPITVATFNKLGIHGVSDKTTLGELTAKAHALKGGSKRTNRRNRRNRKKRRTRRSW